MALAADLSLKLDGSGAQASLSADLGDVGALLEAIDIPLDPAALQGAVDLAQGIDLTNLGESATRIAGELTATLEVVPEVGPLLAPVTELVELGGHLADADLDTQIRTLLERLSLELDGDDGALAGFIRVAEILKGSDQSRLLVDLYGLFVTTGGAPDLAAVRLRDLLPGLAAGIRTLGTLMSLETLLQDAERLARASALELDLGALRRREDELVLQLEALPALIGATDVADLAAVEVTARALAKAQLDIQAHVRGIAEGMAFGQATLVYIDFARLKTETQSLLGALRGEDLSATERVAVDLSTRLGPLLAIDLSGAPRFTLDDLLDQVEAQVADLADRIDGADLGAISRPIGDGLALVSEVPAELAGRIEQVNLAVASALGTVTEAVARVPIGQLGDALRTGADALAAALAGLGEVLGAIDAAVGDAAGALQDALDTAEAAVDGFVATLDALFADAAAFVDGLNLDGVAGTVSDNIGAFADVIAKADLAPYFATASDAIDSTAGVIEKVPFALLPDDLEKEVVEVARPIKQTDLDAFRLEILAVLQIDEEGGFSLRPELEAALATVQEKVDALLATLRERDPASLAAGLAPALEELRTRIEDISPQVELGGVRSAIDDAKTRIAALDPAPLLAPVNAAFDEILAAIDRFTPAALLDDLEARIDEVREQVIDALRLRQWREELDALETRIGELLGIFDLTNLEDDIAAALEALRAEIAADPRLRAFDALGAVVASLLAGQGGRRSSFSFEAVVQWLSGSPAGAALEAHGAAAKGHLDNARDAVTTLEPLAMASRLTPALGTIDAAIAVKADGAGKARLEAAVEVANPIQALAGIGTNRSGYLKTLEAASGAAGELRDLALGEADAATARLRGVLTPFAEVTTLLRTLGEIVGLPNALTRGLPGVLDDLLASAPPERLAAMLDPVYQAIRRRLEDLLAAVLDPLRAAIDELLAALEAVNLEALRAGLDALHAEVRGQIEALRPDAILAEPLAAFAEAKATIQAFDPLGDVLDALEAVKSSAQSIVGKLDPQALVATPQEIFDDILGAFEALRVEDLVSPLLDQLDGIAVQVDGGLEDTLSAFRRLQDALPDRIGSTSLTVSASVSVG